jgi:hypothetical protein
MSCDRGAAASGDPAPAFGGASRYARHAVSLRPAETTWDRRAGGRRP